SRFTRSSRTSSASMARTASKSRALKRVAYSKRRARSNAVSASGGAGSAPSLAHARPSSLHGRLEDTASRDLAEPGGAGARGGDRAAGRERDSDGSGAKRAQPDATPAQPTVRQKAARGHESPRNPASRIGGAEAYRT